MRKNVFAIALIFVLSTVYTQAQFLQFGPRVGLSSSKIKVDETFDHNGEPITYESGDNKMGFHIGAYSRISIASLYVQPELLFTSAGGTINIESESTGEDIQELTYNKLDMPVMVGTKLIGIFRIQAGPVFSLMLNDDAREINALSQASQNYEKASIGYQAGIGIDLGKLNVDLKYEGNLSKMGSSMKIGNSTYDTDMRNTLVMVMVGLNLF